jgi:hypothetical protein
MQNTRQISNSYRYSKEQIEAAKQVDIIDYLMQHEAHNLRRVGREYRLRDHPSLSVKQGAWYWHSQGYGGRTALSFLQKVRGLDYAEALERLQGIIPGRGTVYRSEMQTAPTSSVSQDGYQTELQTPVLILPRRNADNNRVIAYLQSRGIDRELIQHCIDQGILYESAPNHNCVFLGKDEQGKTRSASIRSTSGRFMVDAEGSDKRFGFSLQPENPLSQSVAVFESAIDALSHISLCKLGYIPPYYGWRICTGGSSVAAVEQFLRTRADVTHCLIGTDNDKVGESTAVRLMQLSFESVERLSPPRGNDWNDSLKAALREQQTRICHDAAQR